MRSIPKMCALASDLPHELLLIVWLILGLRSFCRFVAVGGCGIVESVPEGYECEKQHEPPAVERLERTDRFVVHQPVREVVSEIRPDGAAEQRADLKGDIFAEDLRHRRPGHQS